MTVVGLRGPTAQVTDASVNQRRGTGLSCEESHNSPSSAHAVVRPLRKAKGWYCSPIDGTFVPPGPGSVAAAGRLAFLLSIARSAALRRQPLRTPHYALPRSQGLLARLQNNGAMELALGLR